MVPKTNIPLMLTIGILFGIHRFSQQRNDRALVKCLDLYYNHLVDVEDYVLELGDRLDRYGFKGRA